MTMPPMGKMKTRTDHRSLWLTGRDDLRTSTRAGKLAGCALLEVQLQDLLQTRMSRTRTMKPMTPPPAPYCVVASWAVMGAAEQSAARQSWRKRLNIVVVDGLVEGGFLGSF